MQLVNIGFGNIVSSERIVAIVSPESAPIKKRMVQEAKDNKNSSRCNMWKKKRAVLIMDSGHIILSSSATRKQLQED